MPGNKINSYLFSWKTIVIFLKLFLNKIFRLKVNVNYSDLQFNVGSVTHHARRGCWIGSKYVFTVGICWKNFPPVSNK